jgi:poly(beta-D-mannuronate) lyase
MNAIPNSPANGYAPVKDVIVANNTFLDCSLPWNFCAGANDRGRTVIPESTLLVNNLVYSPKESLLFVASDNRSGIATENNLLIYGKGFCTELGSVNGEVKRKKVHGIEVITTEKEARRVPFVTTDITGIVRGNSVIGAFLDMEADPLVELATAKNCGPQWYKQRK